MDKFNLIHDEDKSARTTSFSPINSTKTRTIPQNFLTFSFSFDHTGVKFQGHTSPSPKFLKLNQDHPSKESGFSSQMLIKLSL